MTQDSPITTNTTEQQSAAAEPTPREGVPPSPFDGSERRLDPRTIQVERVSGGIAAAVLSVLLLVAAVVTGIAVSPGLGGGLLILSGWLVLAAAILVFALTWPAVSYRHTFYSVSGQGIRIRRGVVWRTVSNVPRSRVQHTDVAQGPIERSFGLATLIVYTAGTHHASVSLGGLAHDVALAIRDHLIDGGEDDAV